MGHAMRQEVGGRGSEARQFDVQIRSSPRDLFPGPIDSHLSELAPALPARMDPGDKPQDDDYLLFSAACAAARRAIGVRNGEQDT